MTSSQKPRQESSTAKPTSGSKNGVWVVNITLPLHKFPTAIRKACEREVQLKRRLEIVQKQPISDSFGCVNAQNQSDGSQKEKEEWLISEFPKKDRDMEKVSLFMKQTYASQRLLINRSKPNVPSIMEIKDQWPFLFETDMMLQHFEELMGFNLQVILQRSLEEKASVIYDFMKQEHPSKKKVRESLLEIDTAMALDESKIPQMAGVYLLVLAYFGEPEDMMIRSYDETATVEDVVSDSKIPSTPFIAVFGEVLEAKRCGLVVDEVMVNQSINGITEGMMMLFASYFVLNIMYPNEVAATLEFIQRCFVDINPNRGNKRAKTKGKQHTVNPKVLSLANCLKDHASQWVL
ncbi:Hypothetical predicted protein [Paramuricea clavata]|nr:Hypothetical predicted protein [Paramuricea clavata]